MSSKSVHPRNSILIITILLLISYFLSGCAAPNLDSILGTSPEVSNELQSGDTSENQAEEEANLAEEESFILIEEIVIREPV